MVGKFSLFFTNISEYVGNGKRKAHSYYGSVINQSIDRSIDRSIDHSFNQSINQSIN